MVEPSAAAVCRLFGKAGHLSRFFFLPSVQAVAETEDDRQAEDRAEYNGGECSVRQSRLIRYDLVAQRAGGQAVALRALGALEEGVAAQTLVPAGLALPLFEVEARFALLTIRARLADCALEKAVLAAAAVEECSGPAGRLDVADSLRDPLQLHSASDGEQHQTRK